MSNSLRDQLLKKGLVDKKKVKKAQHEERQARTAARKGAATEPDARAQAEATLKARAAADRERARAAQAEAEARERRARIDQIIATNRSERKGGELAHNFVDGRIVKRLYVNRRQHDALASGQLQIVRRAADHYELVDAATAGRLRELDPEVLVERSAAPDRLAAEEAAYADHPIPDDLDW